MSGSLAPHIPPGLRAGDAQLHPGQTAGDAQLYPRWRAGDAQLCPRWRAGVAQLHPVRGCSADGRAVAGGPPQTDCSPSPSPWQWGRGSYGSLAPRLTSEAPAHANGPAAIHAPRSNTSAQHQTGCGCCAKPAGWQGKHQHSWAEGGSGACPWGSAASQGVRHPSMGLSTHLWGLVPSCRAWYTAAGLGTQLWCSSPGHGAQHPSMSVSTWMQGPAPNCRAQHPALGFSTQLWGSAPSCGAQHPAFGTAGTA